MLPLTDYNFQSHIHLYRWQDRNILLDVNSGAVHILDDISYRFIEKLIANKGDLSRTIEDLSGQFPVDELQEISEEILSAYQDEALFTAEDELLLDFSKMQIKAMCLNVAHACNMKCTYCFASQGDFGMEAALMSLETAKQALDFLIQKSGTIRNLEVDFFGGEPTLVSPMLRELVKYGREMEQKWNKHFNFTITTNALLLDDEMIQFIVDQKLAVILSLDGRPETNDRHRILKNGSSSYDLIVPNIKKMVESRPVSYYVRGTFSKKNLDFSKDFQHIIDLGFDSLSLEPAIGADNGFSIQEEDLPLVLQEYERLTELLYNYRQRGRDIDFFHFNLNLQKGPCIAKRLSGCGAGMEYLVVTPTGDIYPCHQFVGEEEFLMGNLSTGIVNDDICEKFACNHLQNKKECRECWARYFCGGGCHANAYHSNGDISIPSRVSCAMHKKRIEGAIYLELMEKFRQL